MSANSLLFGRSRHTFKILCAKRMLITHAARSWSVMSQSFDPPPPPQQPELGSLTQSVRKKGLGAARGILVLAGIVTILSGAYEIVMMDQLFDEEIQKVRQQ